MGPWVETATGGAIAVPEFPATSQTYLFGRDNRNKGAGKELPSPRRVGVLARYLRPKTNPKSGACYTGETDWEKTGMRKRVDKNQGEEETNALVPFSCTTSTLEEFWRHQLNQIKKQAESQGETPTSDGNK